LPGIAHRAVELFAGADHVVGYVYRRPRFGQQCLEPLLALDIGPPGEVLAVDVEQVERVEREPVAGLLGPVPTLEHRLQAREVWIAPGVVGDDLAVDKAWRQVERSQVRGERLELVGPVLPAARIDAHLVARARDQRAVAVELDLVHPAIPGRNRVDQRRELRAAELRQLAGGSFALCRRLADRLVALRRL